MNYRFSCLYCGKEWEQNLWSSLEHANISCAKCGERKLIRPKKIEASHGDVFGYRFSPPFPDKNAPRTAADDIYDAHYLHSSD